MSIFSKINKAVDQFNNFEIFKVDTHKPTTHNRPIGDFNWPYDAKLSFKLYTFFLGEPLVTGELD